MVNGRARIAVIGSGISGLSAAYLLGQRHEVHLFESEARLGGHANTVMAGGRTPVDTGFIVFNELNYPHLTAFFRHLDVPVADSQMTLSVRLLNPDLEWGGTNFKTLIAQKRNLLRPRFWSMTADILRFHREAAANLEAARANGWTLAGLLKARRYSAPFVNWYLIPMGAAIWSTPLQTMLDFPAETFLQFCINHRLLQVNDRPVWKTVRGGSIEYVKRVAAKLEHVHLGHPVARVQRHPHGVELECGGTVHHFDAAVFATHPPQTLRILRNSDPEERGVLGSFLFQKNLANLHSDTSFMPKRKELWSAWNFHQLGGAPHSDQPVSLSYWMNLLQPLNSERPYIVSLNSGRRPAQSVCEVLYEHPLFNRQAIAAQARLRGIQGRGGIFHCGAWTRFGFHEDGILSAVRVAEAMNVPIPWTTNEVNYEPNSITRGAQPAARHAEG